MQSPWTSGNPYGPPVAALPTGTPGSGAAQSASVIDAVRFAFSGDTMNNLFIGAVFAFIPIVGSIALEGWLSEAHQRLVRRHPEPLPKLSFTDLGHYLSRGLQVFLVALIAGLPVGMVLAFTWLGAAFSMGLITAATNEPLIGAAVALAVALTGFLLMILASALTMGLTTRAELSESASDALALGPVMAYTRVSWARAAVKSVLFGFVVLGLVIGGFVLCYFGIFLASIVIRVAAMHLRWQLYEQYLGDGGEPFPVKAPVLLPSEQY